MAVSARITGDLRSDTSNTRICNTCGGPAAEHIYRRPFGYRCVKCVEDWAKNQTVTTEVEKRFVIRLSEPGEGHRGVVADIP